MDRLATVRDRFTLPTHYLDAVERIREALEKQPRLEQLQFLGRRENNEVLHDLRQRQIELDRLLRRFTGAELAFQMPTERIVASLASTEALLNSKRLSDHVLEAAIQPQLAYQDFARHQLELAAATSDIGKANRLHLVDSAADLLQAMNSALELAVLMNPELPETLRFPQPGVNLYAELEVELEDLDLEEPDVDVEDAVVDSGSGRVAELGSQLVRLVYDFNTEAEREGKPAIFKPTTKALYACALIPTRVATDEQSFNELVDHLYFLLYEGSGTADRLTERRSAEEFEALWRVKHLRLGARHDVDHGSSVATKNRDIGKAYVALIGSVMPRSRSEWIQAQVSLYSQLVDMLEDLWFGEDSEPEVS